MNGRLLVIGDSLLDRSVGGRVERFAPASGAGRRPGRGRPGGAGLAAALAARSGRPVTLLTALTLDPVGSALARCLLAAGVDLIDLGFAGRAPERILRAALSEADGVLVSDYGRGVASDARVRATLAARRGTLPLVWDPDPRGLAPLAGATLVTPNLGEALDRAGAKRPEGEDGLAELARGLARRWQVERVCVTLGEEGAVLAPEARLPWRVRCARSSGDPCGAGDMFAAEAAARLTDGQSCKEAVTSAVAAATRFVSDGYTRETRLRFFGRGPRSATARRGSPPAPRSPSLAKALALAESVRGRGGTISATGGCFDKLRRDHVRCLEAASRLGDSLIVLLNSDRSMSALTGGDRPLSSERERAATLRALPCVDEVAIFDGPTPVEALRLLRPEVWAKGSDQAADELAESREALAWGGTVAILPCAEGRPPAP